MKSSLCKKQTLKIGIMEPDDQYRSVLCSTFMSTEWAQVTFEATSGEEGLALSEKHRTAGCVLPEIVLLNARLAGNLTGIETAQRLRKQIPRLPLVFYLVGEDVAIYSQFNASRILTHFAFLQRNNYWPPETLEPVMHEVCAGRSYIDPDIARGLEEVEFYERVSPLKNLTTQELEVLSLIAQGLTNSQIAQRCEISCPRAVSRINGHIYARLGVLDITAEEKVARLRATLIYLTGRAIQWDADGVPSIQHITGSWHKLPEYPAQASFRLMTNAPAHPCASKRASSTKVPDLDSHDLHEAVR